MTPELLVLIAVCAILIFVIALYAMRLAYLRSGIKIPKARKNTARVRKEDESS